MTGPVATKDRKMALVRPHRSDSHPPNKLPAIPPALITPMSVAAEAGVVAFSGVLRGLGRTVMIAHGSAYVTLYAGLEETKLSAGQNIEKGKSVGSSGGSFFFSIFTSGSPQDPARLRGGAGGGGR